MVNLSGGQGAEFEKGYRNLPGRYPGRFIVFANLDFEGIEKPGWGERAAAQLEQDVKHGARGPQDLQEPRPDRDGRRAASACRSTIRASIRSGRSAPTLGIPVLIHSGEPRSFFDPQDKYNERWLELKQFPQPRPAARQVSAVRADHGGAAPHVREATRRRATSTRTWAGSAATSRGSASSSTGCPNVYTEIGAVLAELGRQPRFARDWFVKYQDRVMFGKDTWAADEYLVYFRVLETDDEYFDYYRKRHAFWKMYGLDAARRGPEEGLLQERAEGDPGHRRLRVPALIRAGATFSGGYAYPLL